MDDRRKNYRARAPCRPAKGRSRRETLCPKTGRREGDIPKCCNSR